MSKSVQFREVVLDVIRRSSIAGHTLTLPEELGRDLYLEVKSALESLGGRWNRSAAGFRFNGDPSLAIEHLLESGDTNPKKTYQFYATPDALADHMVSQIRPEVVEALLTRNGRMLEPEAGDGALIRALWRAYPELHVDAFEAWSVNRAKLADMTSDEDATVYVAGEDFLTATPDEFGRYQLIIANPPFAQNQDVRHLRHMLQFLAPGGQLISILSKHWTFANDSPSRSFRSLVEGLPDCIKVAEIESGAFADSGTSVATCLFTFNA